MNDMLSLTVNSLPHCNAETLGNVRPVSTCVFFPITCLPFSGSGSSSDFGVSLIHSPFFVVTFFPVGKSNLASRPSEFNISEMSEEYLVPAVERSLAVQVAGASPCVNKCHSL